LREQAILLRRQGKSLRQIRQILGPVSNATLHEVHIHETGDLQAATCYWTELTKAEPRQFYRPNIKRGNPLTRRKNVGPDYHGCLQIRVSQSCELYRQIDGWVTGIVAAAVAGT
jgi:hypothetical protein